MSRRCLLGFAVALLGLLVVFILTPAGSALRGLVSPSEHPVVSDRRVGQSDSEDSTRVPSKTDRRPARPRPTVEETKALLRSTVIPEAHFVDLTLSQCVSSLNDLIEKAGVDRRDLQMILSDRLAQQAQASQEPWHTVRVKNVPVATVLQYLIDVRGLWYQTGEGLVELKSLREPREESPAQKLVRAKLNKIIIPRIDFEDATIEEAIDFLRQRSIEFDPTSPEPSRKGVSFVVRKPRIESAEADTGLDAEAGLEMREPGAQRIVGWQAENIPLTEALDELTRRAGLRWRIDEYAITILPVETAMPLDRHLMPPRPDPTDPFSGISDDDDPFGP